MNRSNRVSTATAGFVVFVCVALLVLNTVLALRARSAELLQAHIATTNLARSVAQQMDAMISEVEHVLDHVIFELEREDVTPQTLQRLQPLLATQAVSVRQIKDLFVFDIDGQWLVSSQSAIGRRTNDRDYFIHHRDNLSRSMRIGTPIVSRSTGVWIIPLSRRLEDAQGHFTGVVLATIEVDHVLQMMAEFDIGHQGAIALFHDAGELLVRRPYVVEDMGRNFVSTPLHALMRLSPSGSTTVRSAIDDVMRLVSFQHLRHQSLKVTVALAEDELLMNWRHATYVQTAVILTICALAALGGTFLVRAIRYRGRVEARLRRTRRELRHANSRLLHLAQHDGLTGLPNRRSFDERLTYTIAVAARNQRPVAIAMMDVDFFKRYNDHYGHPAGDRCLQAVARAVAAVARRPGDIVARYGGEELVALLFDTDTAGAKIVAEGMCKAVRDLAIEHEHSPLSRVTISIGVAVHVPDQRKHDVGILLDNADAALYRVKQAGRNRVEIHV